MLEVVTPQSIELIAAKAFPAAFVHVSSGWLLRHTPGVGSRRANSVLPLTFMPPRLSTAGATLSSDGAKRSLPHGGAASGEMTAGESTSGLPPGGTTPNEAIAGRTSSGGTIAGRTTAPPIDEALEECRRFYIERGLPVRFQLSPAASPYGLDEILAARGFVKEGASLAMSAPISSVVGTLKRRSDCQVLITRRPSPEWFAFYLQYGTGRTMNAQSAKDLLFRIQGEPMFAGVLSPANELIGIGLGVHDDWLGLFSIATHPSFTRRGVASTLIRALAERGAINGADHVFLQVEAENRPAIALYEKAGFTVAYPYHYRTLGA